MLLRLRQLLHGLPLHLLRHDEQHPDLLLRVLRANELQGGSSLRGPPSDEAQTAGLEDSTRPT
jgi:hypothetical protein